MGLALFYLPIIHLLAYRQFILGDPDHSPLWWLPIMGAIVTTIWFASDYKVIEDHPERRTPKP